MKSTSIRCLLLPPALCCVTACSPAAELRPLSTDRPDTTESPYSVDAGHWQMEMEIASWTKDGGKTSELTLGELNLKYGLNTSTDVQFVLPFFTRVTDVAEGFGDIEVRLKYNLWGNDEGSDALAIMPYVKLPTAHGDLGNGDVEGGLIIPYGFDGPGDWSFGVMGEVDLASDEDGAGYHALGLVSATASHDLTQTVGAFLELVGIFTPESGSDHEAYFNAGVTCALADHVQLDGGVRIGLTDNSADFSPFVGFSRKF
jgi:hypothetical protein